MKHLAWIFIAVFCTALAQVQPVDLPVAKHKACGCCEKPGDCGKPDCALPVAPALPTLARENATLVVQTVVRTRMATGPSHEPFYHQFQSRTAVEPALAAPRLLAPVARVPLFKAHCSFLI